MFLGSGAAEVHIRRQRAIRRSGRSSILQLQQLLLQRAGRVVIPLTLWSVTLLARVYGQQRRYAEAERELLTVARLLGVVESSRAQVQPVNAEGVVFNPARELGDLYAAWGKSAQAAEWQARVAPEPTREQ